MKAITTYDLRPDQCTTGKTFRVMAWGSAALQIVSLYVVLMHLTSVPSDFTAWASGLPEAIRPLVLAAPGVANLLVLCAIGFWFRRFMGRRLDEEQRLRDSESFARATVDALPTQIAILDGSGAILATARGWREFAAANGEDGKLIRDTVNYLAECDALAGRHVPEGATFAAGIRAVATGHQGVFLMEYDCHIPQRDGSGKKVTGAPPAQL